ncbi:hypothetical protein ACROYT_G027914 [Oculina patagonica]
MVKFLILLLLAVHMCRAQDPGIFQFEAVQIRESEDLGVATVVIVNTGNTAVSATVSLSTADSTATGGSDFVPLSGELVTFTSGEARKEVAIPIIDDDVVDRRRVIYSQPAATRSFSSKCRTRRKDNIDGHNRG